MSDSVHFKLTWKGETRRFALSRTDVIFFFARQKVAELIGTHNHQLTLGWKDTTSPSVRPPVLLLNTGNELDLAIDYIARANSLNEATRNTPTCIHLEVLEIGKPEHWYVTETEPREKPEYLYQEEQDDDAASDCSIEYKPSEYAWGEESDSDCSTAYEPSVTASDISDLEKDSDYEDALSVCSTEYKPSEYAWGDDVEASDLEVKKEKIADDAASVGSVEYKASEYAWEDESDMDMDDLELIEEKIDVHAVSDCSINYKPSEYAWGGDSDDDALSECSTAIESSDVAHLPDLQTQLLDAVATGDRANIGAVVAAFLAGKTPVDDLETDMMAAVAAMDKTALADFLAVVDPPGEAFADAALSAELIHCSNCNEQLPAEYVRCPSNSAHKYCFGCAAAYLAPRDAELPFDCPSGEKCASGISERSWEFSNDEMRTLFKIECTEEKKQDTEASEDDDMDNLELMRERIDDDGVFDCSIDYKPSEYAWGEESDVDSTGERFDDDALSDCSTAIEPSDVANFKDLRNEIAAAFVSEDEARMAAVLAEMVAAKPPVDDLEMEIFAALLSKDKPALAALSAKVKAAEPPKEAFADATKSAEPIHCALCKECLTKEYVRCPSNPAHKYCFGCTWAYVSPRPIGQPFYCPSGEKCASGVSDRPWELNMDEVCALFMEIDGKEEEKSRIVSKEANYATEAAASAETVQHAAATDSKEKAAADDDFDLKEAFMNAAASIKTDLSAAADAVENWLQTDAKVALKGAAEKVEGKLQAAATAARNGLNELFYSSADKKEKKCKECPKLEKRIDQLEKKINLQSEAVEKLVSRLEKMENRC